MECRGADGCAACDCNMSLHCQNFSEALRRTMPCFPTGILVATILLRLQAQASRHDLILCALRTWHVSRAFDQNSCRSDC